VGKKGLQKSNDANRLFRTGGYCKTWVTGRRGEREKGETKGDWGQEQVRHGRVITEEGKGPYRVAEKAKKSACIGAGRNLAEL